MPEELEKHLILNSNRLRTFEDARLEVVTYVEAKFGLRSIVSRLAKEKGHQVRVICVLSAVEHIFDETAMHARTQASNRLARHGPRVRAKVRVKRSRDNPKENPKEPKVPKARTRAKHRNLVSQVLKTRNQRQARKLRNLHRHVPLTLHGTMVGVVTNGTMAGVLMDGMTTGVLLDSTKVGNKRMTLLQTHFHLEVWILVPRQVRSGLNG